MNASFPSPTLRAFIAVETDAATRQALKRVQDELRPTGRDVKWVAPENFHVTLLFLGDVPMEDTGPLKAALEEVSRAREPFTLSLRGGGRVSERPPSQNDLGRMRR